MRISVTSVFVSDQARALRFYTEILGFQRKLDIPMGEHRWLTVVSPEVPEGVQLLLEPLAFEPAQTYQRALREAGIPATSFSVDDCWAEYRRLRALGVTFRGEPVTAGAVTTAVLEDTCGNLLQLAQVSEDEL